MHQMQSIPPVRPDTREDSLVAQDTAVRARRALLVLAAGAFAVGTDAFVIAGILPAVARGVGVSVSWAGALMTGFALTNVVAAPVVYAAAGLSGASISVVLAGFGAASAAGSALGGRWTDRAGALPVAATALLVLAASLAGLAVATGYRAGPVSLVFIATWGMAGWALIPAQQHRLLSAAPGQLTVLLGLNSSAIYLGATLGSILGALTLAFSPAATVSTASAIAAAAAGTVVARAGRHRAASRARDRAARPAPAGRSRPTADSARCNQLRTTK
jgi:predicted MFS family arabinose efflux permease